MTCKLNPLDIIALEFNHTVWKDLNHKPSRICQPPAQRPMPLRAHNVGIHKPSPQAGVCLGILEFDTIFHSTAEQLILLFLLIFLFSRQPLLPLNSPTVRIYQQLFQCVSYSSPTVTPIKPHPLPAPQSLTKPLAKTPMPSWALLPPAIPPLKPAWSSKTFKFRLEVLDDTPNPSGVQSQGQPGIGCQAPSQKWKGAITVVTQ